MTSKATVISNLMMDNAALRQQVEQLQAALSATVEQRDGLFELMEEYYLATENTVTNDCSSESMERFEKAEDSVKAAIAAVRGAA